MKKTVKLADKLKMRQYVVELRQKLQERAEQLESKCADAEKREFAKLQDEITALTEIYRYYFYQIYTEPGMTELNAIDDIEQIESMLTTVEAQMISGQISKEHLIEVFKKAKENLLLICKIGKIEEYADLLLAEPELLQLNKKNLSTNLEVGIDQNKGEER